MNKEKLRAMIEILEHAKNSNNKKIYKAVIDTCLVELKEEEKNEQNNGSKTFKS